MSVVATKNGKKRTFNDITWKLLGKNKEGWVAVAETEITNSIPRPGTGEKKPVIEQPIKNEIAAPVKEVKKDLVTDVDKESFLKATVGINAGVIKDYFDSNNVKFDKTLKKQALIEFLGEHLNWNINEFQRLFS